MSDIFTSWEPDPVALVLNTGYNRFESSHGIDGLAKTSDNRLDLLALIARNPAQGQFRAFITACKDQFDVIAVWEIWNITLRAALERYGFTEETDMDCGEVQQIMVWRKPL